MSVRLYKLCMLLVCMCLSNTYAMPSKLADKVEQKVETTTVAFQTVVPTEYSIDMQALAGAEKDHAVYNLTGHIAITITCRTPTDKVELQAGPLVHVLDNALLTSTMTGDLPMKVIRNEGKPSTLTLILPKNLTADHSYQLKMNFTRMVTTSLTMESLYYVGLFIEPGHATDFFPCFDTTDYKAPVELNVTHLSGYVCLAASASKEPNKVLIRKNGGRDWEMSMFEKTQPLNIHSLSIFVGDFVNASSSVLSKKTCPSGQWPEEKEAKIRIWSRGSFAKALTMATEMGAKALCYLQCYLNVKYHNKYLDIVVLPYYSGPPLVGASVAYFKESDLQQDPNRDGLLLRLAKVAAEQYFGVLVTPVPEARALSGALVNFLAAETVRHIRPNTQVLPSPPKQPPTPTLQFNSSALYSSIMMGDQPAQENNCSCEKCKCAQYQQDRADLLANAVYSLYYEMGSQFPLTGVTSDQRPMLEGTKMELVLRMLSITLGEQTFMSAIKGLIENKRDAVFTADDLWGEISFYSKPLDIKTIANSWIQKDRIPLLNVTRDGKDAHLVQSVFRRRNYAPEERDLEKENSMIWNIPIVTIGEGQSFDRTEMHPRMWMTTKSAVLDNATASDTFLVVNPDETAPCIVNYDKRNWELLANAINDNVKPGLTPRTRAKLLHDAVMLAHAGVLPFCDALPLLRSLEEELSPTVWLPVGNVLDHVRRDVEGTYLEDKFTTFLESILRKALSNVADKIGENKKCWCMERQLNESRALILQQLSRADMQPCIAKARQAYKTWASAEDPDKGIPMADSLMCCLFQWGDEAEFEFGVQRLLKFPASRQRTERAFLLRVLAGCPRQVERKFRIMNVTLLENNGTFSEEDQRLVMQMVSARGHSLLTFLDENWDKMRAKVGAHPFMWEFLVIRATGSLKTQDDLNVLKEMHKKRAGKWGVPDTSVQQAIKMAEENVAWSVAAFPSMQTWLDNYLVNNKKE